MLLEQSAVSVIDRRIRREFIAAETVIRERMILRSVEIPSPIGQTLLWLAHTSQWLLQHPGLSVEPKTLRGRYLRLLCENGFANQTGRIKMTLLREAFIKEYSSELLALIGCGLQKDWLMRLCLSLNANITQPPLRHLLFIRFLKVPADVFFQLPVQMPPFDSPPWPCLNRASEHYGVPLIQSVTIRYSRDGQRLPVGKFACRLCGFTYSRVGPDEKAEDRMRYDRVHSYGSLWEQRLKELYKSKRFTLAEIAERLGITHRMLGRRLSEVGLWGQEVSVEGQPLTPKFRGRPHLVVTQEMRQMYRSSWGQAVQDNPHLSRAGIKGLLSSVHTWLKRHDPEWLAANSPTLRKPRGTKPYVDWQQRDLQLANSVRIEAARIKQDTGLPVRISPDLLHNRLGLYSLLRANKGKLPLTVQAIEEVVETREALELRRIAYAKELCRREHLRAIRSLLLEKAKLTDKRRMLPHVREAVEQAILDLITGKNM